MKTRKKNRLTGWNYSGSGAYFITICTEGKKKILSEIVCSKTNVGDGILDVPQTKLSEYGKIVKNTIEFLSQNSNYIKVNKYVIMPNHIHLIIFVNNEITPPRDKSNEIIPKFVSSLKRYVNKQLGHSIFQRSFHDHIIRNAQDYHQIWTYIDSNPLKWKSDCFYI